VFGPKLAKRSAASALVSPDKPGKDPELVLGTSLAPDI
jgi:hypothetical protein